MAREVDHATALRMANEEITGCEEGDACEAHAHVVALAYLDLRSKAEAYLDSNRPQKQITNEHLAAFEEREAALRACLSTEGEKRG